MPAHPPDGDFYVSPVYLAGSTFTGDPALQPLLDQGFHLHHDEMSIMWNQESLGSDKAYDQPELRKWSAASASEHGSPAKASSPANGWDATDE